MTRRNTLAELLGDQTTTAPAHLDRPKPVASGALRSLGLQLDQMEADASKARDLESKLEAGQHILELDPNLIDSSFIKDRISIEDDAEFDVFVKGIAEHGQQVPILVRPSPSDPGRYQVAYGHRRVRATARLGISVRAIVKVLTDAELVIAQARENLDRKDLTFVERTLIAQQLDQRKFDRLLIASALGIDQPELSRLLTIARTVPPDLIHAIGPAPKIGRPRWLQLSDLLKDTAARKRALAVLADQKFKQAGTNQRFGLVIHSLFEPPANAANDKTDLKSTDGVLLARVAQTPRRMRLLIDNPEFKNWLLSRLPTLVAEFEQNDTNAAS